jgi:hypothetical protein
MRDPFTSGILLSFLESVAKRMTSSLLPDLPKPEHAIVDQIEASSLLSNPPKAQ